MAQSVKSLPGMRETCIQSLGWEDSPGEGNGNPFQYSCLGNPMDRGDWRATVHGVIELLFHTQGGFLSSKSHFEELPHFILPCVKIKSTV